MTIKQRMRVKVLWLAHWTATEIAEFDNLPVVEVEELIKVYKAR